MTDYSSTTSEKLVASIKEHICKPAADAEVIDTIYFKLEGCFAIVINCTEEVCYFNLCRTTSETFAKITFYDEVPYPMGENREVISGWATNSSYPFRSS